MLLSTITGQGNNVHFVDPIYSSDALFYLCFLQRSNIQWNNGCVVERWMFAYCILGGGGVTFLVPFQDRTVALLARFSQDCKMFPCSLAMFSSKMMDTSLPLSRSEENQEHVEHLFWSGWQWIRCLSQERWTRSQNVAWMEHQAIAGHHAHTFSVCKYDFYLASP